jgi:hypothetical protein
MTATDPMLNVPKSFDGGDIDNHGRWWGQDMSCLECRETTAMHAGITSSYLLASKYSATEVKVESQDYLILRECLSLGDRVQSPRRKIFHWCC